MHLYLASIYDVFPFRQLIDVNDAIVKFWHNSIGLSWGASIIGLTVVIRLLILPLTFRQVQSMQGLQRLQPEMKKLQERYKDDRQRLNEEMIKFYREHGVNPLGSCLPLLLQLPFFFSLYGLQQSAKFKAEVCPPHGICPSGGGGAQFWFIPNILKPATGAVLVALIVLYVASQLGASLVSVTSIQDKNQRRLMFALPFLFLLFIIRFQAGLIVYWITTNVWTLGQQLAIKRFLPTPAPVVATAGASAAVSAKPGSGAKGSGGRAASTTAARGDGKPSGANGTGATGDGKAPPPSPRKRKKRSGRRR